MSIDFRFLSALIGCAVITLVPCSGCRRNAAATTALAEPGAAPGAKQYHLRGTIVAKSLATTEVTVKHEEIPGLMPAMTMVYKVKDPAVVEEVQPGDTITADLLVSGNGQDYLLDDVVITDETKRSEPPALVAPRALKVGESVPDVPLVNQDGKTFRLGDYRGKALLVTFVYTRCPMPTACPLISSHFARVHEELAKDAKAYAASHLVSISLDPSYDKPPVLRTYGLAYLDGNAAGFAQWEFADTTPGDLRKLADAFGLEYTEEDNQITHTMETTLIGPDGKVAQTWDGSGWDPHAVAQAVRSAGEGGAR